MTIVAVLESKGVTKQFGGLTAVSEIDLKTEENQICSLIEPDGAGKTTVFNIITSVYQVTEGDILSEDRFICGCAPYKIVEMGIARTYQNTRLFKKMMAIESVMTGFHCRSRVGLFNIACNRGKMLEEDRTIRKKSEELSEYLKVADLKDKPASSPPYGHQKLPEIARAMATQPKILLLDEPAASMNAQEKGGLISTIRGIRKGFGISVLIMEHDINLIMNISDDIAVLNYGAGIVHGVPERIRDNEGVIEAYLGRSDSQWGREELC